MKDVSANFFDDFYLQVCTACEDKLLELEWKLEVEKKESNQDVLRTYRGNDSNLLIVFYVQIMPDDFVMQLHRF